MTNPPETASATHQELFWAEMRLERLTDQYLKACHTIKDFQYSSVGIELSEKMRKLSEYIILHS